MKKLLAILFLVAGIVIIALLMQVQMKGNQPTADAQNNPIDGMNLPLDEMSDGMKSVVKNIDDETAHQVLDYVKQKSKDGSLSTKDGIKKTIDEAEDIYNFSIAENSKDQIAEAVDTLQDMGFSTDIIVDNTEKLYDKYGAEFVDHLEEAFVDAAKDAAKSAAESAWDKTKENVKQAIDGIIH